MIFQIGYNKEGLGTEEQLKELGAKLGDNPEFYYFELEVRDFDALRILEIKIDKMFDYKLSMVVGFDPATIYLDNI